MKQNAPFKFSSDADYFVIHFSRTSARRLLHSLQVLVLAALLWLLYFFLWNLDYSPTRLLIHSILYPLIASSFSVLFLFFLGRYKLWWIAPVLLSLGICIQLYSEFSGEWGPIYLQFITPSILDSMPPSLLERRAYAYSFLAHRTGSSLLFSLLASFVTVQLLNRRRKKKLLLQGDQKRIEKDVLN